MIIVVQLHFFVLASGSHWHQFLPEIVSAALPLIGAGFQFFLKKSE
jgi:hypothetical protein